MCVSIHMNLNKGSERKREGKREREVGERGNEVSKQEKKECGLQEKLSLFIYALQKWILAHHFWMSIFDVLCVCVCGMMKFDDFEFFSWQLYSNWITENEWNTQNIFKMESNFKKSDGKWDMLRFKSSKRFNLTSILYENRRCFTFTLNSSIWLIT